MKEIKVPGVLWVVAIVVLLYVMREYFPQTQPYSDVIIMAVAALLKMINVSTDDTDELVDIIKKIESEIEQEKARPPVEGEQQSRGIGDRIPLRQQLKMAEVKKTSKTRKFLVG